jgi:death-on-curing protein
MRWRWLRKDVVVAIHDELVAEHGGRSGVRDSGLLASALSRPHHQATYRVASVFDLAAGYANGIVFNHPFVDGNKRTGLMAAYLFLYLNGWQLVASEADAVAAVVDLANKQMDETGFSKWLEDHAVKILEP